MNPLKATITATQAAGCRWDSLIVGAGPAGAVAARGLAQRGMHVLLVDKAEFPRWKICGCCLNGAAAATLSEVGLGHLLRELRAPRLNEVQLRAGGYEARLRLPEGYSLSRERFDDALVREAIRVGAQFLPNTRATWRAWLDDGVVVGIECGDTLAEIRAGMVLAADGLAAGFTRHIPGVRCRQRLSARLGAGATIESHEESILPGTIHMSVGRGGYVGRVRLEDGRVNVAAAFDPELVKAAGGLHEAACRVLEEAGSDTLPDEVRPVWRGTPPLTRYYLPPADGRLLLIGDAASYVEPFTGEGMAWALASGAAVVPVVERALCEVAFDWRASWMRTYRQLLGARQWRCRVMASLLRHPRVTSMGIRLLAWAPSLAVPYLRRLNRSASFPV